jgi:Ca2+-binding EF-hand superfamily protein
LERPELLLLLRATAQGVSKVCCRPPPQLSVYEQLASHAFATACSPTTGAANLGASREKGLTYVDLCSWVQANDSVKHFLAAVSPAAIRASRRSHLHGRGKAHGNTTNTRRPRGGAGHRPADDEDAWTSMHKHAYLKSSAAYKPRYELREAAEVHRKHTLQHLEECRRLRDMFDALNVSGTGAVSLSEFTRSLPASLRSQANSMFRAVCDSRYMHFDQLLHECYPNMDHTEIAMLTAATRCVRTRQRRTMPVRLTAEQTEEMNAIFDMYDTDHSGLLTVSELTAAMTATGVFSEEECRQYFDAADHLHHHALNRAEFVHFFQSSFIAEAADPLSERPEVRDLAPLETIHAIKIARERQKVQKPQRRMGGRNGNGAGSGARNRHRRR